MIRYRLVCTGGHEFEGWFQSSGAFEVQIAKHAVSCVSCGSTAVTKAIMAPSIAGRFSKQPEETTSATAAPGLDKQIRQVLRDLKSELMEHSEYVGPRFAEEARSMHYKESPARAIFGEATEDEAKELDNEGIGHVRMPRFPDDHN